VSVQRMKRVMEFLLSSTWIPSSTDGLSSSTVRNAQATVQGRLLIQAISKRLGRVPPRFGRFNHLLLYDYKTALANNKSGLV
jgi:hypothetical protein